VVRAGAEILVAGSSIFHAPDISAAARALRSAAEAALPSGESLPR
jgi:pentose-5-phosphate-3-epimerase